MSVQEVKIVKCDRCDTEAVVGLCDPDTPPKWLHVQSCGDLCEPCAHQFKSFVMDFFDGHVPDDWKLPRAY